MPANLTPEYIKADQRYKQAGSDSERLEALEQMLRAIPKHKGTEHMQADLKKKVSRLKQDMQSGKKGGSKTVDVFYMPKGGAGQVVLIGTPNSGKSSIVGALSNAKVNIAEFEFSTQVPLPGMAKHEDVSIEIVDTPPITADYAAPGQVGTYRNADLIGIVIDLSTDCLVQMDVCMNYLREHRLLARDESQKQDEQGNQLGKDVFVICTKADAVEGGTFETFVELTEDDFDFLKISAQSGNGLEGMMAYVFKKLDIVRVYSKKPGEDADMKEPFTLPAGSTITDLAGEVHRELAEKLQAARIWGTGVHDGQNVQKDHVLHDKDIVELTFPRVD